MNHDASANQRMNTPLGQRSVFEQPGMRSRKGVGPLLTVYLPSERILGCFFDRPECGYVESARWSPYGTGPS